MNIITFNLLLGLFLSADAFSIALVISDYLNKRKTFLFIMFVSMFHFIMPILGAIIGNKFKVFLTINSNILFGFILMFLGFQLLINVFKDSEETFEFSIYEIIMVSFSVALDSFTLGFGLSIDQKFTILSPISFSIISATCTYIGLIIGKYVNNYFGIYFKISGALALIFFGIIQFFWYNCQANKIYSYTEL